MCMAMRSMFISSFSAHTAVSGFTPTMYAQSCDGSRSIHIHAIPQICSCVALVKLGDGSFCFRTAGRAGPTRTDCDSYTS
jgi:hypothetical protein